IASADPLTLGIQESPGAAGADVYVGEGQSLGIPLSYGGPYLGLMAAREKYIRRLPGRIAGRTVDVEGRPGFVMVLRTREQDIRREKATSNICTNQGLLALWATVYLSMLGKAGLSQIARLCFDKSQYLGRAIAELPGYELPFGFGYLKEFVVSTPTPAAALRAAAEEEGLFVGLSSWQGEELLQIAVTEKRTRSEMDRLVEFLRKAAP
ncbi:MAG: glycine dehydrogenase, partial [Candidatus Neomarinimicrobiota bacterium]